MPADATRPTVATTPASDPDVTPATPAAEADPTDKTDRADRTAVGADDTTPPDEGDTPAVRPVVPLPVWFEIGLLVLVMGVVCCGGLGLGLAVVDRYSFGLSVGVGGAATVVASLLGARALIGRREVRPDRSGGTLPAVVAVLFVVAQVLWNAFRSGNWITIDRDPAAYAVAAKWLTGNSGLIVPYQEPWTGTGLPLKGSGAAIYEVGGQLEFQFNHLLAVLLAQAGHLGGDRALLAGNALLVGLALLAVYAMGVRLVGRPWVVLTAVVALGMSLPILYVARATYSEGVTMLLVWAGTWLLVTAWDRAPLVLGLLGGAALGASVMARVDALVYLLPLPLLAAVVAVAVARDERWRRVAVLSAAALVGGIGPVAIGTVDVERRSGQYFSDLAPQIGPLQKLTVAVLVLGVVVIVLARVLRPVSRAVARIATPRADVVATVLGVLAVGLVVFAWAVRPAIDHQLGNANTTVGSLQAVEGVGVDPTRTYSEQGVIWLSWYLGGPLIAFAALGFGVMVRRAVKGAPAALALLGVTAAGTLLYLYKLSNTPDQLFGVRRYVPAVLPLFVVAGALGVAVVVTRLPAVLPERGRRYLTPVTALLLVLLLAFPLGATWRVRDFSPRDGLLATVDRVCDTLGPDAAVLFPVASYGSVTFPMTLRTYCGVPVVAATTGLTAEQIRTAADVMAGKGYTLWVVDDSPDAIATLYGAGSVQTLGTTLNRYDLPSTLTRPPDYYVPWGRGLFYGAPVPR